MQERERETPSRERDFGFAVGFFVVSQRRRRTIGLVTHTVVVVVMFCTVPRVVFVVSE
jgi:hypothetical protein